MTIREFQALAEGLSDKDDYISCKAEISHGEIEFAIWSGTEAKFFRADTPDAALELFRKRKGPVVTDPVIDMEVTEPNILQQEITGDFFKPTPNDVEEFYDQTDEEMGHKAPDPSEDMPF